MNIASTTSSYSISLRKPATAGLTLVEIIISLLLLAFGLLGVIALTLAGTREADIAISRSTAFATARSALNDPQSIDPSALISSSKITGFMNGYYVQREILQANASPTADLVRIQVYWGETGDEAASLVSLSEQ